MPSIDELDAKFAELVEELDLTAPNKEAMLSLPSQKKWQIYCSRKSPVDSTDGTAISRTPPTPEHYIERLKDIAKVIKSIYSIEKKKKFRTTINNNGLSIYIFSNSNHGQTNHHVMNIISKLNRIRHFWMH